MAAGEMGGGTEVDYRCKNTHDTIVFINRKRALPSPALNGAYRHDSPPPTHAPRSTVLVCGQMAARLQSRCSAQQPCQPSQKTCTFCGVVLACTSSLSAASLRKRQTSACSDSSWLMHMHTALTHQCLMTHQCMYACL